MNANLIDVLVYEKYVEFYVVGGSYLYYSPCSILYSLSYKFAMGHEYNIYIYHAVCLCTHYCNCWYCKNSIIHYLEKAKRRLDAVATRIWMLQFRHSFETDKIPYGFVEKWNLYVVSVITKSGNCLENRNRDRRGKQTRIWSSNFVHLHIHD